MNLTREQLVHHYEIEKELANKLRNSSKIERKTLYAAVYNELYSRIPYHPQLVQKSSKQTTELSVRKQMKSLRRFLNEKLTFLEIGPGDCALSMEVCKYVKQVYAVDVSVEITNNPEFPVNFKLLISDGSSVPVAEESVNVAYSHQLMEHLHPDDALDQLKNIHRVLVKGGLYFCITPNRSYGPDDISKHFDRVATGFHLKEYSFSELSVLFIQVGFSKVKACFGGRSAYIALPVSFAIMLEKVLSVFPRRIRQFKLMRGLLQIRLIGIK